jgi:hypothetical protein
MINGKRMQHGKNDKILIVGSTLGIIGLSLALYSPSLEAVCQSWSSGLYNKYNTLNAKFDSLSTADPRLVSDPSWEDVSNEWMTYQTELYSYYGFCYLVEA